MASNGNRRHRHLKLVGGTEVPEIVRGQEPPDNTIYMVDDKCDCPAEDDCYESGLYDEIWICSSCGVEFDVLKTKCSDNDLINCPSCNSLFTTMNDDVLGIN